ncbi:hypothetical protein FHS18_001255 [Paenibacillus phyllosphaerae]|uniref:Stressosome-associated protein Prli42 n=1 Tax=Paenibacillus phyllosphaerae TaxID=274593 RepID=A0A7W5AUV0_9BACL|nr:hypothetical protein [Paenibacillus phyllosphaerae]
MRPNRFVKIFVWFLIVSILLSTLLFSIGWMFE